MAVMGWLLARLARRKLRSGYTVPLEMGALYWHLVDIVWIFLWPLLYLAG
jgi:cytochrome c oxidase subunit 3